MLADRLYGAWALVASVAALFMMEKKPVWMNKPPRNASALSGVRSGLWILTP